MEESIADTVVCRFLASAAHVNGLTDRLRHGVSTAERGLRFSSVRADHLTDVLTHPLYDSYSYVHSYFASPTYALSVLATRVGGKVIRPSHLMWCVWVQDDR